MKASSLFSLACAGALLALGSHEAAACHVVKVVLQENGDKVAVVSEYTPDGAVTVRSVPQGDPPAGNRQATLTPAENGAVWSTVQSLAAYMGKTEEAPPGSAVSLDLSWDTGQKAHLAWPAAGNHPDAQAQLLLQQLLKARPAGK